MKSLVIWMTAFALGLSLLILTAAAKLFGVHALITASITFAIVIMAVRENQAAARDGMDIRKLASLNTRYAATIWAFATVAIVMMFGSVLKPGAWPFYALSCAGAAILCLSVANLIETGDRDRQQTERVLRLARLFCISQLVISNVAILALWVSGKLVVRGESWAADQIVLFASIAIGIISVIAMRSYGEAIVRWRAEAVAG